MLSTYLGMLRISGRGRGSLLPEVSSKIKCRPFFEQAFQRDPALDSVLLLILSAKYSQIVTGCINDFCVCYQDAIHIKFTHVINDDGYSHSPFVCLCKKVFQQSSFCPDKTIKDNRAVLS